MKALATAGESPPRGPERNFQQFKREQRDPPKRSKVWIILSLLRGFLMRQSQSKLTSKQDLLALNLGTFLSELTAISIKHGIGIEGSPILVAMEAEDFERKYTADERAQLKFA